MFRMKTNHTQENKGWRLIRNLSIVLIIIALILFSIILISGKVTKLDIYKEAESINAIPNGSSYFNILPMPENQRELSEIQEIEFKGFVGEMFISSFGTPTNSRELLLKDFSCFEANEEDYGMKGYECFFKEVNHSSFAFVSEEQIYDRKIQEIEQIAQTIAKSHKYKINEFDCTDFTKSLVGNLTKEGYNARCIIGYKKQNPKQIFHAWTEVNLTYGGCSGSPPNQFCEEFISDEVIWIESTTGEIVTEENKPYYKPLKGFKKYQCY